MIKVIFDCERVEPNDLEKKIILKDIDVCGKDILSGSETGVFWYMYKSHLLVVKTIKDQDAIIIKDFVFNIVKTIDIKSEKKVEKSKDEKSILDLYRERHKM